MDLPCDYTKLSSYMRRKVRMQYETDQGGACAFCKQSLSHKPDSKVTKYKINLNLFPQGFLKYPVHLQHNHDTGMTEGAVHSYCNAVLWQYFNR